MTCICGNKGHDRGKFTIFLFILSFILYFANACWFLHFVNSNMFVGTIFWYFCVNGQVQSKFSIFELVMEVKHIATEFLYFKY